MFRTTSRIWIAYSLILAVALPGLAWLSWRVLALERQEFETRWRSEQEERLRLALWRMESVAMPIVAAEAARPYFAYEPFQPAPHAPGGRLPSPLLRPPTEHVLLNFQARPDGTVSSPQCVSPRDVDWACQHGTTPEIIAFCCPRQEELQSEIDVAALLRELPAETQPVAYGLPAPALSGRDARPVAANMIESPYLAKGAAPPAGETPAVSKDLEADYASRSMKLQSLTQRSVQDQRQAYPEAIAEPVTVREGASRAVWFEGRLLLARRVQAGAEEFVQGCWLDWDRLRTELQREVADLIPKAELRPVGFEQAAHPGRTLASLPIELVAPPLAAPQFAAPNGVSRPLGLALAAAWIGLLLGCSALAGLLYGVTSLSERRAAFVSAVTHELRTPLTTFQLYTEMLAQGMVADADRQREYIATLHQEAGRLGRLVDNVLAYARLERRPVRQPREPQTVAAMLQRTEPRLRDRAERAGVPLDTRIDAAADDARIAAEPTVIDQILLNLVDNACKYAGTRADAAIELAVTATTRCVELRLSDRGPGLSPLAQRRLFTPFCKSDQDAARTAPGLGLGLALSRDLARSEGGDLVLEANTSAGATFLLRLPRLS